MTPKERVLAALAHQRPDRVPFGEIEVDGPIVEAVLGRATYYRNGLKTVKACLEGRRNEVVDSMKKDYVDFVRATGMDLVSFAMEIVPGTQAEFFPLKQTGPETYRDENGNVFVYSKACNELMWVERGSGPVKLMERNWTPTEDEPYAESELEFARHVCEELGETHFIVAWGGFFGPRLPYRSSVEDSVMWIVNTVVEDRVAEYRDHMVKQAPETGRAAAFWKSLGAHGVWLALDIGSNQGPFIAPETCREMFLPGWQAQVEACHAAGVPVIFHCCGNNRQVWDIFLDAGFDAYQSIQEEEPLDELKEMCAGRMALMGGVSCRSLDNGTPEQIREQTRNAIETCSPGGGFILASSHSLHTGVKLNNFKALLETLREYAVS